MFKLEWMELKEYMAKRREKKHWSKKDVEGILKAMETNDWSEVHNSKFYNKYGPEYCTMLEAIWSQKRKWI